MKFNNKLKLVECTKEEKAMVEHILLSSCFADAKYKIKDLIQYDKIKLEVNNRKSISYSELDDMCSNIISAIYYNYKYLKVNA